MARASVTTQKVTYAGANAAGASPTADGDIVDTGGTVFLLVSNTGAAAATVTVQTPATYDSLAVEDLAVSLPAGASKAIGPLRTETFGFPAGTRTRAALSSTTPAPSPTSSGLFFPSPRSRIPMLTLKITGDNGFDEEVVAKPRHVLVFERITGIPFSKLEEQGISMGHLYQLGHLVMKMLHPEQTPEKLAEFEESFDVLPVGGDDEPDPGRAGA